MRLVVHAVDHRCDFERVAEQICDQLIYGQGYIRIGLIAEPAAPSLGDRRDNSASSDMCCGEICHCSGCASL